MLRTFYATLALASVCLAGCIPEEAPSPPVVPMPQDLSQYRPPALVQPSKKLPPLPQALDRKPTPEEKVFDYAPGVTFRIPITVGLPLSVALEPGEERRTVAGGDPEPVEANQEEKRWSVREGKSGRDGTMQEHLIVQPRELGLKMGLVLTTTRRVYSLVFESVKQSPTRFVRFRYSDMVIDVAPEKEPQLLPAPDEPRLFHVGYTMQSQGSAPAWMPMGVWDDGEKMYVVFPEVTMFQFVPLLRAIGAQGPQVINSRQFLNVVILDQLHATLELRLGMQTKEPDKPSEQVTITRGALRTITCPGDPACPQWPAAAQQLAGR